MAGFTAYTLAALQTFEWAAGPGILQVGNRDTLAAITVDVIRDGSSETYQATHAGDGLTVDLEGVRQFVLAASSYPATILFVFGTDPSANLEPSPIVQVGNTITIGTIVGTVTIAGAVTISGTVNVSGSIVDVSGSTVGVTSVGGTVTVAGSVIVSSGTVSISGGVTVSGTVAVSAIGGTVTVGGSVAVSSGSVGVTAVGGTVTVAGSVAITNTVTISGTVNIGTITGGTVSISGVSGNVSIIPGVFALSGNGAKLIAVTGTRVALAAGATPTKVVMVKARRANAGTVYLGTSTVTNNETATGGLQLEPGDMAAFTATDLSTVFLNGTAGDGVSFAYWT